MNQTLSKRNDDKQATKLVSIIVPVYNTDKYVKRCISSLVHQTYENIEVIIVNDGSSDGSKAICAEFAKSDKRIRVMSKKHEGASASRNLGLSKSKGDYITFADSDDWLELDAVENMVGLLEQENVNCVRTTMFRTSSKRERVVKLTLEEKKYYKGDILLLLKSFVSGNEQCTVGILLFKRSLLLKLKPFKHHLHMMEDTCFYIDLLSKVDSIYLSNITTYHYFESEYSVTRSPENYIRNANDILLVNSEIKRTLNMAGLLNDSIKQSMDLEHVRLISEYPYLAFVNAKRSSKYIVGCVQDSQTYRELTNSVDTSKLTIGHRYTVKYLISEDNTKLFMLFRLRHLVDQSQSFIKKFTRMRETRFIMNITTGECR